MTVGKLLKYAALLLAAGLGLSIVQSILEKHGADSVEGGGTTFWFECEIDQ